MAKDKPQQRISASFIKRALQGAVPNGGMKDKNVLVGPLGRGSAALHEVRVPDGTDAYSGTIRSHEGRHVSFTPIGSVTEGVPREWLEHKLMNLCCQFAEDCYIESRPLPKGSPPSYHAMHRQAAREDLESVQTLDPKDPSTLQAKVLIGARTMTMFGRYAEPSEKKADADDKGVATTLGPGLWRQVYNATIMAQRGERANAALRLFRILGGNMDELEPDPPLDGEEVDGKKTDKDEPLLPGIEEAKRAVCGKRSKMEIIELPRTVPTKESKEPVFRTVYPDSGSRINTSRLVHAVVSGDARGVFMQNLTEPHGESVYLIDSSGSMRVTSEALSALCREVPSATVAYYCGTDDSENPVGWLYVYGKQRKRFAGDDLPIPKRGNSVDLPALQWAAQQRGPITLVSDLGFCGASDGEIAEAHGLVAKLQAQGRLTVINSIADALKQARKKNAA